MQEVTRLVTDHLSLFSFSFYRDFRLSDAICSHQYLEAPPVFSIGTHLRCTIHSVIIHERIVIFH